MEKKIEAGDHDDDVVDVSARMHFFCHSGRCAETKGAAVLAAGGLFRLRRLHDGPLAPL